MYGMPQPSQYGQYSFGGYASPSSPSMPKAAAAAGLGLGAAGATAGADPTAAASAAAWGADPTSYYQNYWSTSTYTEYTMRHFDPSFSGYYGQTAPGATGDVMPPS